MAQRAVRISHSHSLSVMPLLSMPSQFRWDIETGASSPSPVQKPSQQLARQAWQRYREKLSTTSFVANVATNVQFMVKDRKKCVSTGDWAFALFTDGKPDAEEVQSAASPVTRRPEIT